MSAKRKLGCGLLVVLVVAAMVVVGLLVWGSYTNWKYQSEFYRALMARPGESESLQPVEQLQQMLGGPLLEKVDLAVLAAWQKAMQQRLGEYEGTSWFRFHTDARREGEQIFRTVSGPVDFTGGQVQSKLVYRETRVVDMHLEGEKMAGWGSGPASFVQCRTLSGRLAEQAAAGQVDALMKFAQGEGGLEKANQALRDGLSAAIARVGANANATHVGDQIRLEPAPTLLSTWRVSGADAAFQFTTHCRFPGHQPRLVALEVTAEGE